VYLVHTSWHTASFMWPSDIVEVHLLSILSDREATINDLQQVKATINDLQQVGDRFSSWCSFFYLRAV
jgi:hypothetical protein